MKVSIPGVMEVNTKTAPVIRLTENAYNRVVELSDNASVPVSKIKPTPKVGDTLWIKQEVKRSSTGEVLGLMRNQKPVKSTIVAVFLDGSVRDNHSDCWEVKPSSLNNWETINPQREGKQQ